MLIRCDKCSTLYELDEKLLPAQGAPVQCSKCQFVFKAYPSPASQPAPPERAANDAPVEPPPEPEPALPPDEQPHPRRDEVVREGGALAHSFDAPVPRPAQRGGPSGLSGAVPTSGGPRSSGGDEQKFTSDGRPIRKIPFPSGDAPPQSPRTPPMKGPIPKTGPGVSTAVRWAVVVGVVLVALVVAWFAWRSLQPDPRPARGGAPAGQSRAVPQGGTPETPARN